MFFDDLADLKKYLTTLKEIVQQQARATDQEKCPLLYAYNKGKIAGFYESIRAIKALMEKCDAEVR